MDDIRGRSRTRPSIRELLADEPELLERLARVKDFGRTIRASEYHLTNACNIRCHGCWFFVHDFDKKSREEKDPGALRRFIGRERERGINTALLIGGEPTLMPERIAAWVAGVENVSISTNGLVPLPREGFERTTVFVSLFGGGRLDDELRAIRPNGRRFRGLFDRALANYRRDPRVTFVFALTEQGTDAVEETVQRIEENGNQVIFNFYSEYGGRQPIASGAGARLMDEALRVASQHPETVLSTPYYIEAMMTGRSHWDAFGYANCPSISIDHPAHRERIGNGNRTLPLFNAYAADLETVEFCCTSGHCEDCRDSQAVFSWLLVSLDRFLDTKAHLRTWIELAESYWAQFCWSPFHRREGVRRTAADGNRIGEPAAMRLA